MSHIYPNAIHKFFPTQYVYTSVEFLYWNWFSTVYIDMVNFCAGSIRNLIRVW